ncbi:MAG: ATP-binding cassette domain-containing protein [Fusobacteriaceae bacterium]|jgi:ATP-binding cassette subfamily F protein 3|nr:ATP-binding cassette domain-containing protein [Fusobacteriaceae bacterium]
MAYFLVNNLYMGFSGETLFQNVGFSINENDKIGLIGINGAGKTTLLQILLGEREDEIDPATVKRGTIAQSKDLRLGYLSQNPELDPRQTIFGYLMEAFAAVREDFKTIQELNVMLAEGIGDFDETMEKLGEISSRYEANQGYNVEYKVRQVLNGLGIEEALWQSEIGALSGGEKSRTALARVLLDEPDLLILDEPTNHLDLVAIEWLERFLRDYGKALLLVSHDVYFLDNVCNKILELEQKTIREYRGNYTDFVIQKEAWISGAVKAWDKEQEKIRKMEEFIRRYKAGVKSRQARGREKLLNRMEKMENPVFTPRKLKLRFEIDRPSADLVLRIRNLSKSFDGKTLFQHINLDLWRGDRVGIIGKNGVGKSTLLKIINGVKKASSGDFVIGEKVTIGYYDQTQQNLDERATILDELRYGFDLSDEAARTIAGGFLFSGDAVEKVIGTLSGGEKARVALMKIMLRKPNFLIFDEPTNHLDLYSREILIEALEDYEGTLLLVSHDRNFLDSVVREIYEIHSEGATLFHGDYDAYRKRRAEKADDEEKEKRITSYEDRKKLNSYRSALERKIQKAEEKINRAEAKKAQKENLYRQAGIANDLDGLLALQEEIAVLDNEILSYLEEIEESETELGKIKK